MAQTKTDRRVRKTRGAIHHAMLTLMRERGYDAVTVTDIIEQADVGRSTFYAHFTDKRHVLDDSLADLAEYLREQSKDSPDQIFGFSLAMFEHAAEQRAMATALLGRRSGTLVQEQIAAMLSELALSDLIDLAGTDGCPGAGLERRIGDTPIDLVAIGAVGAFMGLLAHWIDSSDQRTPRQMNDAFQALVVPGILTMLDRDTATERCQTLQS